MSGSFGVPGIFNLTISIDGTAPDPLRFALGYIRIQESITYPLPVGIMVFATDVQYWTEHPIIENAKVHIEFTPLASMQQVTEPWDFRVFSVNQNYKAPYRVLKVVLITDSPTMFFCHPRTILGNSSDVLNQLAAENALVADIDPSADHQLWQQANRRNVLWAKDVCDHAYADPSSHYIWCNTRDNWMVFANMNIRKMQPSQWLFAPPSYSAPAGNEMWYDQVITHITSGINNRAIAYGTTNVTVDFTTGNWIDFNPDDFNRLAPNVQYATDQASANRMFTLAPNIGNDHDFYNDAHVQNPRYRAMYSVKVRLGTQFPLDVSLIDNCDFKYYDPYTEQLDTVFSGKYWVSQIDTRIGGSRMYRFVELISDGIGVGSGFGGFGASPESGGGSGI